MRLFMLVIKLLFHVDIDFAKLSGLDEVIVQGMFSTGFLVRLLTNWVP